MNFKIIVRDVFNPLILKHFFFLEKSHNKGYLTFIYHKVFNDYKLSNVFEWKFSFLSHTYIHNWPYNPSVRVIDLVSHTTYVVYVNFIHKWRDLQFKVDSERQIF